MARNSRRKQQNGLNEQSRATAPSTGKRPSRAKGSVAKGASKQRRKKAPRLLSGNTLTTGLRGDEIRLLHDILSQFGHAIADKERTAAEFGPSTEAAVQDFQKRHGLATTGVVDQKTATLLNQLYFGETSTTDGFLVSGTVRLTDGAPAPGVMVRAFDKDLPSLNRDEPLGEPASTNATGYYEIAYTAKQFGRTDVPGADVFVLAFDAQGTEIARSEVYYNAPAKIEINLTVTRDSTGLSEYERLLTVVLSLIEQIPIIKLTDADVEHLARETTVDAHRIHLLVIAYRHAARTQVPPEGFYGLMRMGLLTDLLALLAQGPDVQRTALKRALSEAIIPKYLAASLDELLARLTALRAEFALHPPDAQGLSTLGAILATALPSPKQHTAFVSAWMQHQDAGGAVESFWEVLRQDQRFTPTDVENLQITVQLSAFTLTYAPLVQVLQKQRQAGQWTTLRDLARFDVADWSGLITQVTNQNGDDLPAGVPGKEKAERIQHYATMVADAVEQRFPTAVMASRLAKDEEFALPHKEDVLTFFKNQPEFELRTTYIKDYLAEHDETALSGISDAKGLTAQLEAMQRVAHVTPRFNQMRALLSQGIDSALRINQQSPEMFMHQYEEVMGGKEQAAAVYKAAEQKTAMSTALIIDLHPAQDDTGMAVLPLTREAVDAIPDLRTLFGSLEYCACEHCRSVLSPAAYLVDVLQFLRNRPVHPDGRSARDMLFWHPADRDGRPELSRRPDLGEIELTCENTNTEVPYLDLVNEVLENAIVPVVQSEDWRRLPLAPDKHELFQTRRSATELRVYPEHLNADAYAPLRDAIYPWTLPFDLQTEEMRAYLGQLGTSRTALIETVRPFTTTDQPFAVAIARDVLGMTATAWQVIADPAARTISEAWGGSTDGLSEMQAFLKRSGLTHAELTALLDTRFVNPDLPRRQVAIEPVGSCNLDEMRLNGLTEAVLRRVHRFVRLWRLLGWPMREVDLAIRVLGGVQDGGLLDHACLLRLAGLKRVQTALRISVSQALSFWSPLDTAGPDALYTSVFWNPALRSQFGDAAFDPARLAPSDETVEKIAQHTPPILAALRLTAKDLETLQAARRRVVPANVAGSLTLDNLSFLYRHAVLSQQLNLSIPELLALRAFSEIDPFLEPAGTLSLIEVANTIRASNFSVNDLRLLFLDPLDAESPLAPSREQITRVLSEVRVGLHAVWKETVIGDDPAGEQTRRWLGLLHWNPAIIDEVVKTLTDQIVYEVQLPTLPENFAFPDKLRKKITYERVSRESSSHVVVRCRGVLTSMELEELTEDEVTARWSDAERTRYVAAMQALFNMPRQYIQRTLAAFASVTHLNAFPPEVRIPPALAERLTYDPDIHTLRFAGPMTTEERQLLQSLSINSDYDTAIGQLFAAPDAATQPFALVFLTAVDVPALWDVDETPPARFARLLGKLQPYLRHTLGARAVVQALVEALAVPPEVLSPVLTRYLRSIAAPDHFIIDDFLVDFPDGNFAESSPNVNITAHPPFLRLITVYRLLHNVALVLAKFEVTPTQLPWLFRSADDPTAAEVNLNLLAHVGELRAAATNAFRVWSRLVALFRMRDRLGAERLTHIFALAQQASPNMDAITRALSERTEWRVEDIQALVTAWGLRQDAFRDEQVLIRLSAACDMLARFGASAEQGLIWSQLDVGPVQAESVRQAVEARYTPDQWPAVAQPLRDRLREQQRDALVSYLIAHPLPGQVWNDAHDLYAYFLIDVEMSACQPTTRIKLAHSTVQLFVQRCLMNLEQDVQVNAQDSGWRQWEEWMKHYRIWEANRQVFLYPENWIEPELRHDKTAFFKDLENELQQDDLTAETAENAFLHYFDKLDTVGRLEISAMYRQPSRQIGDPSTLHVFGRTRGTPHVYYYRRQVRTDFASSWTPWEKVDVDIEGDHLIPVVWNDRLYVFWPVFLEQTEQQPVRMPASGDELSEPPKYTKLQLAWSQFRYNKWTPKTVSHAFAKLPPRAEVELYFQAFPSDGGDLLIRCTAQPRPRVLSENEPPSGDENIFRRRDENIFERRRIRMRIPLVATVPVTREVQFRVRGLDGTVRRLPLRGVSNFISLPWGTHLEGMSFVEDDSRTVQSTEDDPATVLVFANAPEGDAEGIGGWYRLPASVQPAIPSPGDENIFRRRTVVAATPMPDINVRRQGDHNLRLPLLLFGTQSILQGLPEQEGAPNRFRIVLPYNQLDGASEFFYQDDTRTFYCELTVDRDLVRYLQGQIQGMRPGFPQLVRELNDALANQKYEFHPHYHPYVRMLMQHINREGIKGLLQRQVQVRPNTYIPPPQRFDFERWYNPNRTYVRGRPIEEMDFSLAGAYAQYNWEMFFHAPFLIANKLSKNQRFDEAQRWFHYIFDPTDMSNEGRPQRYWRTKRFFQMTGIDYQRQRIDELLRRLASGENDPELNNQVAQWRDNPFTPHVVARTRTVAFQRTVVMKYLDNLIAWGDHLFRQETSESINEATQLYILAAEILGPRPQKIQPQAAPPAQTYYQLEPYLDHFANALVQLENRTPQPRARRVMDDVVSGEPSPRLGDEAPVTVRPPSTDVLAVMLPYFCLTPNDKLIKYWDTVAQRLFNIRHCKNIEGAGIQPSLFGESIDPGLLVHARALGVDLRTVLSDLNAPLPHYRFPVLLQKAAELCADVRGFAAALLAALEKKDAEELARMRSGHELTILEQMQQIREQQLVEARRGLEALQKSKEAITLRRTYYASLAFMNAHERQHLRLMGDSVQLLSAATSLELLANIFHIIPNAKAGVPTSVGVTFGGDNLGKAVEAFAKYLGSQAGISSTVAGMSATMGGYRRRSEEWDLQVKLADKELEQIEKQIAAAEIRVAIAQQESNIHKQQMRQARQADNFMRTKFTNQELYDWMSGQLAEVYFQSYQMAFDMAKRAERAFRFDRGLVSSNFIQYGYWDSLHKGLMAGERLQMDLRRLELAYIDQNRRDYELTKHISLALLDPFALHLLRTDGECTVTLPEALFDRDHPGHYMRRIKSVALTLPAVVGPYTSVNCRLTLQSSFVRINPDLAGGNRYLPEPNIAEDDRFSPDFGSVQSIATSRGHSDAGLFEVNFHDERYLPFEGAGAISTWRIELDPLCNDFDLSTLSDVVIELRYTARDGGQQLREQCMDEVVDEVVRVTPSAPQGRLFSARTDFADAWNAFLYPIDTQPGQTLVLDLNRNRFPFRAQQGQIVLTELHVVLMLSEEGQAALPRDFGGIQVVISDPSGHLVTPAATASEREGLLLSTGGDPQVGTVIGGSQRLSPEVNVNRTNGANRWQLTIPQAAINALPEGLRTLSVSGPSNRLVPEMFEDLLVFAVYVSSASPGE